MVGNGRSSRCSTCDHTVKHIRPGGVAADKGSTWYHTVKHRNGVARPVTTNCYRLNCRKEVPRLATEFEQGLLVGVLIGEGHFGGDGRNPQITLRMHVRHEALFAWIEATFPGGKLYGPYFHGGRHYMQWMARGAYLREVLVPLLDRHLTGKLDGYGSARYEQMKVRYARQLRLSPSPTTAGPVATPVETGGSGDGGHQELHGPGKSTRRADAAEVFDRLRRQQGF
jgi:hypothetical protein